MTNVMEPRGAAMKGDGAPGFGEGELTSLVRRWMAAGTQVQDRVQLQSRLLAPDEDPVGPCEPEDPDQVVELGDLVGTEALVEAGETPLRVAETVLRVPTLPRRPQVTETERATRLAVLIDARRVSEDVAAELLARLGDRGSVAVCRAYADWSKSSLGAWAGRREGLHSFHQFADDDDQALVAMAIDAVDIAREASVDEVVLAGDMTSMLPLVHRLHGAGVRVRVVGPGHTPHDVQAACDEFLDEDSLLGEPPASTGRHRA